MIEFQCPHCGKTVKAEDSGAGRRGKCNLCGGRVKVPKQSRLATTPPVINDPDAIIAALWSRPATASQTPLFERKAALSLTGVGILGVVLCLGLYSGIFKGTTSDKRDQQYITPETLPQNMRPVGGKHIVSLRDWQNASYEDKIATVSVVTEMRPYASEVVAFVDSFCATAERNHDPNGLLDKKDVAEVAATGMVMIRSQHRKR